ncbi:MAG: hypothetical protein KatS3mg082_1048 [Nitrospiraceae bacterium]|nr:MAG: hypothetical protein KatS3mg082_1048 [Nitrospiraceae bacterium]
MRTVLVWTAGAALTLALVPTAGLAEESPAQAGDWHYGGSVDLSYAVDFNFPENHRWRSKTTTPRVNELAPNMVLGYVRKDVSPQSRWGLEFGVQGGYDTDALVPQPVPGRDKPVGGADTLRHLSRANVSYLAPLGNGVTLTAGLFNSFIGYQSIYAKNNLNYTRSYMADNAPYFMFGLGAQYPVNERLRLGLYAINGYNYLAHPNDHLSYGMQAVYHLTANLIVTENLYYGPDQSATDLRFWRFFSDSIVEWKRDRVTLAVSYDIGTEEAAEAAGHPRTFWTAAAAFARWNVTGPWSVAVRPELYWDRNGRMTGSEQFIKAVTATLDHSLRLGPHTALLRLEYRFDESTGAGGGFFKRGEMAPGVIGLTGSQHLAIAALIWSFDS